jgi:hypothetical protein
MNEFVNPRVNEIGNDTFPALFDLTLYFPPPINDREIKGILDSLLSSVPWTTHSTHREREGSRRN